MRCFPFPLNGAGEIKPLVQSIGLEGEGSKILPDRQGVSSCPFDLYRSFKSICVCLRSGYGPHLALPIRCRQGLEAARPFVQTVAGSGPRHLAFHGNGRWIYVEWLNGTVAHDDAEKAVLEPKDVFSTLRRIQSLIFQPNPRPSIESFSTSTGVMTAWRCSESASRTDR